MWIEENKTDCGVFGSMAIYHGSLRIMTQINGIGPAKRIGTITPDSNGKSINLLIDSPYIETLSDPDGMVKLNVKV